MNIFDLLVSPFLFIIKQIFLQSYALTNSYGLSIVFLSFFISLLLLPIFILIEKAKKRDDLIKQKMKPVLDEIKKCYRGQERFYYIQTLNRQHNYSPFRALIPILSLLLQIPFFIAAYQFLESFEPLQGISFLFVNDLSLPDGLFGVVNFLPIAMTLVNLLTVYFYTRRGDNTERKQMLIVAALFLVLLFNLPAGLVLYWTMNNVFSFFRLFLTNPEVFKVGSNTVSISHSVRSDIKGSIISLYLKLRTPFAVVLGMAILSQVYWAVNNDFNDIGFRLIAAMGGSIGIIIIVGLLMFVFSIFKIPSFFIYVKPYVFYTGLFLSVYFYLSSIFYFTGTNNNLLLLSLLFLIPLQGVGGLYFLRSIKISILSLFLSGMLILILAIQLFNIITITFGNAIKLDVSSVSVTIQGGDISNVVLIGLLFICITLPWYVNTHKPKPLEKIDFGWLIFSLVAVYLSGLVFLWNPLIVYSSSPETFNFPAIAIIKNNYKLFLFGILIPLLFFLMIPAKGKRILVIVLLLLAVVVFINSTLIPIDLGSLQESRFSEHEKLAAPLFRYIMEAVYLVGVFIFIHWIYRKKLYKSVVYVLVALNLLTIGQSFYSAINTGAFFKTGRDNQSLNSNELHPIPFSKEKENILYFVVDGFQGWFVKQIMDENPSLKHVFSGFTWYPNTVSMANYTHASIPSMLAGNSYSVSEMNNDLQHTIKEKMQLAAYQFITKVKQKGYYYTTEYLHYSDFADSVVDNTIPLWSEKWKQYGYNLHLGIFHEVWYQRLYENAIFNGVPLFFKPKIYNDKKWLSVYSSKEKPIEYKFKGYNFLRLLLYISNSNSTQPNLIYFHNGVAHNPWNIVDDNGAYITDVTPYENNEWVFIKLGEWINWMKQNGVYDNTKIVFISDHGASWGQYDGKVDFKSPLVDPNNSKILDDKSFWRLNPLLLVKDFNASGMFKEDWRLMTNADAPAIIFDENNPSKGLPLKREIETYWTVWASKMVENKTMKVKYHFLVKDNMFDLTNWKHKNK